MNTDQLFIQCPTCKTVFRAREEQLLIQSGKVRCGQCRRVFDGRDNLVDLTPRPAAPFDMDAAGPPTVSLRTIEVSADFVDTPQQPREETSGPPEAAAIGVDDAIPSSATTGDAADEVLPRNEPVDSPVREAKVPSVESTPAAAASELTTADVASASSGPVPSTMPPVTDDDDVRPYRWQDVKSRRSRAAQLTYGLLALVLLVSLGAQAAYHFRHLLAANQPSFRPHLVDLCRTIGCTIDPPRNKDDITIESHDLQADPAHQGLLILQTTMRNRATHAVAFPHLELELDNLSGQPIVRRVFLPVEYAGAAADFGRGIPGNSEWNVKLFLDASGVGAGGYHLYLFYP